MTGGRLFRLIYVSRNRLPADAAAQEHEVDKILAASRRNNAASGITGALLFSADCFAQALEGPADAVEAIFERIQMDPRHSHSIVLQAGKADKREFGAWSMACTGRQDADRLRFDTLTSLQGPPGQEQILGLLRGAILRSSPGLTAAL